MLTAPISSVITPKTLFSREKVACPFDPSMCVGDAETPAIRLDSGLVDLNEFGFNLPYKDRVQFRKQTTCTVLTLENRTTVINASDFLELNRDPLPQEELMMMRYGDVIYSDEWKNATFYQPLIQSNTSTIFDIS